MRLTEEEKKERKRIANREYRLKHKKDISIYMKEYQKCYTYKQYQREYQKIYQREYYKRKKLKLCTCESCFSCNY